MSESLCQVCWNPKRKPRFQTRSVRICQWCITELTDSLESPVEVIDAARCHIREKRLSPLLAKLQTLESSSTEKPTFPKTEIERTAVRAKQQILGKEGIGQFFYRQLFDDSAREKEVATLTSQFQNEIELKHRLDLKSYELRLQEIASSIAQTKVEVADVGRLVEADFQKFMDIRLSPKPTKHGTTRLLRAHNLGLIQPDRVYAKRPEGSELHVHHIIPLSFFGTNNEQNLATLCYSCHNRQHPEFKVQRMHSHSNGKRSEV